MTPPFYLPPQQSSYSLPTWLLDDLSEAISYNGSYAASGLALTFLGYSCGLSLCFITLGSCLAHLAVKLSIRHNVVWLNDLQLHSHETMVARPWLRIAALIVIMAFSWLMTLAGLLLAVGWGFYTGFAIELELNLRCLREDSS